MTGLKEAFYITCPVEDAHKLDAVIQGKVENQIFFNGQEAEGRIKNLAAGADFRMISQQAAFFFQLINKLICGGGIILGDVIPDFIKVMKSEGPPEDFWHQCTALVFFLRRARPRFLIS